VTVRTSRRRRHPGSMTDVKQKYFSPRAIVLHVGALAWLGLCALAAYWQVGRAAQGNALSYLYAVEWPCFGLMGIFGWWALLHTERVTEHQEQARREYEEAMRAQARAARAADATEADDPELAAYNDHLDQLAETPKKKLWGH
jgi:hypothetical protein